MHANSSDLPGLLGLEISMPVPEPEGSRYAAHRLRIGPLTLAYRSALLTPKKAGAFVTLWCRSEAGPIRPLDATDAVDGALVEFSDAGGSGLFVFSFAALQRHGIASHAGREGKRGFRLYAPWTEVTSKQAGSSKTWQGLYFLPADETGAVNPLRLRSLLGG